MKKIILASTSPRRKELMENLGLIFEIVQPKYDEKIQDKHFTYETIENISKNKALSVADDIKEPAIIISADTVVVINNIITGKPKDREDAFNILKQLSNITHKVVTSICIMDTETKKLECQSTTSEITFNKLSNKDIEDYIDNFKPFDKAGAYGVQELPDNFVKDIKGDFDNIMGLPTKTLIKMLTNIKN